MQSILFLCLLAGLKSELSSSLQSSATTEEIQEKLSSVKSELNGLEQVTSATPSEAIKSNSSIILSSTGDNSEKNVSLDKLHAVETSPRIRELVWVAKSLSEISVVEDLVSEAGDESVDQVVSEDVPADDSSQDTSFKVVPQVSVTGASPEQQSSSETSLDTERSKHSSRSSVTSLDRLSSANASVEEQLSAKATDTVDEQDQSYSEDFSESSTVTSETQKSVKSATPASTPRVSTEACVDVLITEQEPSLEKVEKRDSTEYEKESAEKYEEDSFESSASATKEASISELGKTKKQESQIEDEASEVVEELNEHISECDSTPSRSELKLDLTKLEPQQLTPTDDTASTPKTQPVTRESTESVKSSSPRSVSAVEQSSLTSPSETSLDGIIRAAAASVEMFGEQDVLESAVQADGGLQQTATLENLVNRLTNQMIEILIADTVVAVLGAKSGQLQIPVQSDKLSSMDTLPENVNIFSSQKSIAVTASPGDGRPVTVSEKKVGMQQTGQIERNLVLAVQPEISFVPEDLDVQTPLVVIPEAKTTTAEIQPEMQSVDLIADCITDHMINNLISESISIVCDIKSRHSTAHDYVSATVKDSAIAPQQDTIQQSRYTADNVFAEISYGSPALCELSVEYISPGHVPEQLPLGARVEESVETTGKTIEQSFESQEEVSDKEREKLNGGYSVAMLEEGLCTTGIQVIFLAYLTKSQMSF